MSHFINKHACSTCTHNDRDRNFLYRDMKCGRICLSHGGQLPVLHRRKGSQHFMNGAKSISSLVSVTRLMVQHFAMLYKLKDFSNNMIGNVE